jgi:hypothetical protein
MFKVQTLFCYQHQQVFSHSQHWYSNVHCFHSLSLMATRRAMHSSNAAKHPGEIVNEQKQKRRTKKEMAHDRQVAEEIKEKKALEQQKKHDAVASVEHQIEEKDMTDHTNPPHRNYMRRRTAYALLPETISSDEDIEAIPQPRPVCRAKRANDDEVEVELTDIEEERPKKKNKAAKTNVQEAITASCNTLARSGTVMIVDKEGESNTLYGKTMTHVDETLDVSRH